MATLSRRALTLRLMDWRRKTDLSGVRRMTCGRYHRINYLFLKREKLLINTFHDNLPDRADTNRRRSVR